MKDSPFFDTNVLIYAFAKPDPRCAVAEQLLSKRGVVSVHVLNEFVAVSYGRLKKPIAEIREALSVIALACPSPLPISSQVHEAALRIMVRYGYHIYDAVVIAAALQAGCTTLYTEDMHDGQVLEGLTIRNPFRATA